MLKVSYSACLQLVFCLTGSEVKLEFISHALSSPIKRHISAFRDHVDLKGSIGIKK